MVCEAYRTGGEVSVCQTRPEYMEQNDKATDDRGAYADEASSPQAGHKRQDGCSGIEDLI